MFIHLIGNYSADNQESMLRYAQMLFRQLSIRGHKVALTQPPVVWGRLGRSQSGLRKWLGYVDKFILFPGALRKIVQSSPSGTVFHVCDHSNAMYGSVLGSRPRLVTCHDLLAVRGALGDPAAMCRSSKTGVVLQRWILGSLSAFPVVACVSEATRDDLQRLVKNKIKACPVIPNPLNGNFQPLERADALNALEGRFPAIVDRPFLLHVGSSQPRKNRAYLARMLAIAPRREARIVFAGEAATDEERRIFRETGLEDRLIEYPCPSHLELLALYSLARALVFPSWSEGFGWPVIEAQACGCPVICSKLSSLPEVAGGGALLIDPGSPRSGADALQELSNPTARTNLVRKGFENIQRFETAGVLAAYESAYEMANQGACA